MHAPPTLLALGTLLGEGIGYEDEARDAIRTQADGGGHFGGAVVP